MGKFTRIFLVELFPNVFLLFLAFDITHIYIYIHIYVCYVLYRYINSCTKRYIV